MDDLIRLLQTPEECQQIAKIFNELAQKARLRSIELRALSRGYKSGIELELYKVLYAYEDVPDRKT